MRKIIVFSVVLLLLLLNISSVSAINVSGGRQQGIYYYHVRARTIGDFFIPVRGTNTEHNKGRSTTVSATTAFTNTRQASSSLSIGGSAFVTVTASIGVSQSQSYSTSSTVSYTIPASTPSGFYRIEHVFPQSELYYTKWGSARVEKVGEWTIRHAPDTNAAYRRMRRYA